MKTLAIIFFVFCSAYNKPSPIVNVITSGEKYSEITFYDKTGHPRIYLSEEDDNSFYTWDGKAGI